MSKRWYIKPVVLLALGALGGWSCATPIREDPPSKLGETDGTGGGSSSDTDDSSSPSTTLSSNVSGSNTTVMMTSSTTVGAGTGGGSSDTTSASNTTSTSSTDGTGGGGTTTSSTDGSGGGDGGTGGDGSSTTVGASTTGAGMTTGDLPFEDDFESYTEGGAASLWNPMESSGGWQVVPGNGGGLGYAPLQEASNRNLSWAGDETWTNMRFEVDVRMSSGGDSTRIYFAVRAVLPSGGSKLDYYFGYLRGDGRVRLGKYIGGSTSDENTATDTSIDAASWNTVAITVVGDAISMEVNGTEYSTHTLTGSDAGFVAIGVDSGLAEFDNVSVTAP